MISRRNIRVKVMQALYTIERMDTIARPGEAGTILKKGIEQSRHLFTYLLYFITEVARYAEIDARNKAAKHLPTASDLEVNTKIAGNLLLWKILENPGYTAAVAEIKPELIDSGDLVKKTYTTLISSEEYIEYTGIEARDAKQERLIIEFIFTALMLPNEDFISHVEEHFIHWDDDAEMMDVLVLNFLQKPGGHNLNEFVTKEKWDFAKNLLETVIEKKDYCMETIKPKLKNWDSERIATLDMIIMRMGICEFLYFETIPTRVTINEYIDLAKEYSTPQSGQFVNGILDNTLKDFTEQNKIHKKTFKNSTL
jgi:transcription antitermination protein NusB